MHLNQQLHNGGITGWVSAIALALLLNAVLFGLMPGLLVGGADHKVLPPLQDAINVFRIKRQEPPLPDKQKPKLKEQEKEPEEKKVAREALQQKPVSKPRLPFEINSRLPAGPGMIPTLALEKYTTRDLGIFSIQDLDKPLHTIMPIKPIMPLRAKQMGIDGWVILQFIITEEGLVDQVEVIKSEPQGVFETAALRGAKFARFKPPIVDGVPVRILVEQKITFKIENE